MIVDLPESYTRVVSEAAVRNARQYMSYRGWTSGYALSPIAMKGTVGIQTELKFLMYQERGTKPFLMKSLEGKTVPIRGADGLHFVRVRDVGKPGWVTLPGGVKKWRDQKWRHPGIQPTNFMTKAVQDAVRDTRPALASLMKTILGYEGEMQP